VVEKNQDQWFVAAAITQTRSLGCAEAPSTSKAVRTHGWSVSELVGLRLGFAISGRYRAKVDRSCNHRQPTRILGDVSSAQLET